MDLKSIVKKKWFKYLVVIFLFGLFSFVNTYPLIFHFSSSQLGDGGDGPQYMWDLWWFNYAVTHFQNPYYTNFLNYPNGTYLYIDSLTPLNGIISMPFQAIFSGNMIPVYNLMVILNFVLSGIAMFILLEYLIKNKVAAFIGSYIFTFAPYIIGHNLGQLNLVTVWPLPLFLLFFIKFCNNQSWKNMLLSLLFLVLSTLGCWYYGIFAFLLLIVYLAYYLVRKEFHLSKEFWLKLGGMVLLYFLILSPLIISLITSFFSGNYAPNPNPNNWPPNPDLFNFFFPGGMLTMKSLFSNFGWWKTTNPLNYLVENQNFLGYVTLALSIAGITFTLKKKNKGKDMHFIFWLILGFVSFVFALGTKLKILGKVLNFSLPYHYVFDFISFDSKPGRFVLLTFLVLSFLSAVGIKEISRRISKKSLRILFYSITFALVVLEFLAVPFVMTSYPVSPFYHQLASDNSNFAVYDLTSIYNLSNFGQYYTAMGRHMYYQIIDRKAITDDDISRPGLNSTFYAKVPFNSSQVESLGIKYVICSLNSPVCNGFKSYNISYQDKTIIAYKVPQRNSSGN